MKLTERRNGIYLTEITTKDIGFKNIGGKLQANQSPNDKPSHTIDIKIRDEEILAYMKEKGINARERQDYDNPDEMVHLVKFKAYPRNRFNAATGQEEVYPRIVLREPETGHLTPLAIDAFSTVDSSVIDNVTIRFHIYEADFHGKHYIPVIDELWCDTVYGPSSDSDDFLASLYGAGDEEEVPFK